MLVSYSKRCTMVGFFPIHEQVGIGPFYYIFTWRLLVCLQIKSLARTSVFLSLIFPSLEIVADCYCRYAFKHRALDMMKTYTLRTPGKLYKRMLGIQHVFVMLLGLCCKFYKLKTFLLPHTE